MRVHKMVLNIAIFQVGWLVCVLAGDIWAAVYLPLALWAHQRWLVVDAHEWWLIGAVATTGGAWDFGLMSSGQVIYAQTINIGGIPFWLMALWLLFATTVSHSLAWLQHRLAWAALLGAILGPLSYWGGQKLGAAQVLHPLVFMLAMAVFWALLMPCALLLSRKIKRAV